MAKILVAPANFGLGHATRDIPIIREFLSRGHQVDVATDGAALKLLKKEFPKLKFYVLPEYNKSLQSSDNLEKIEILKIGLKMVKTFLKENKVVKKINYKNKYDMIISDGRYGVYSKSIPSFMICHQLKFKSKVRFKGSSLLTEMFNDYYFRNFDKVIVPDNRKDSISLSGEISKPRLPWFRKRTYYAGIISSIDHVDSKKDIDILVSVSGPEPYRTDLEKIFLSKIQDIKGKKVVILGKPGISGSFKLSDGTIVRNYATRSEMSVLFARSKLIISRSGYTTVMELADLGSKKALFIPTPGSTEQEFLAERYLRKKWVYCVNQDKLDLSKDVLKAQKYSGLPKMPKTKDNVKKLYDEVFSKYI